VTQQLATALGVTEQAGEPLLETLVHCLQAQRQLIVLDNCEHLIDACAVLTETLVRRCPSLGVLATSHERLGAVGETIWLVPALTPADASALFLERMAAATPRPAASPSQPQITHLSGT
jgi:predicted ATPase